MSKSEMPPRVQVMWAVVAPTGDGGTYVLSRHARREDAKAAAKPYASATVVPHRLLIPGGPA